MKKGRDAFICQLHLMAAELKRLRNFFGSLMKRYFIKELIFPGFKRLRFML